MKLAFAGTPAFARVALDALHAAGHDVACVLTQPDRPAGRGLQLQPSEVKRAALALGLPVLQPAGLRLDGRHADDVLAARAALEAAAPDAIVVAAYGLLLPPWLLALPRHGCLNIHASLLPRWRGAAPIHRAIAAGDLQTGVCIMQMDAGLDTGDVLFRQAVTILPDDTTGRLHDRLAALGAEAVLTALADTAAGRVHAVPQPAEGVTYATKIDKREAEVDWRLPAAVIERWMRAFDPSPGAFGRLLGEPLKLWRGVPLPMPATAPMAEAGAAPEAGTVLAAHDTGLTVACGDGALRLVDVQRPGGKRGGLASVLQHWARQGVQPVGRRFESA